MRSAYPDRLGVCLDTCHINDAGYPVANVDQVLDEFDRIIGLNHLKVIHLNDSKNPMGSHKDRHENIGYGTLGFETLEKWFKHPKLEGIPFELETPWLGKILPYRKEIEMLRSGQYETGWRETLIASESLLSAPDKSPNP
jgi:deoxyribonuclease-4